MGEWPRLRGHGNSLLVCLLQLRGNAGFCARDPPAPPQAKSRCRLRAVKATMLPFANAFPSRSCRHPSGCSVPPQVTPRGRVEHKSGTPRPARAAAIPVSALEHWRSGLLVLSGPGHFPLVLLSVAGGAPLSGWGHSSTLSPHFFISLRDLLLPTSRLGGREPIRSSFI